VVERATALFETCSVLNQLLWTHCKPGDVEIELTSLRDTFEDYSRARTLSYEVVKEKSSTKRRKAQIAEGTVRSMAQPFCGISPNLAGDCGAGFDHARSALERFVHMPAFRASKRLKS
jgi:hypothetical protein